MPLSNQRPSLRKKQKIQEVPGLIYIANFVSAEEEKALLEVIDKGPWDHTLSRRTQQYGFMYDYKTPEQKPEAARPIPEPFKAVIKKLETDGHFPEEPDQVIVNEYEPGQGIAPHIDNINHFKERIYSISLGSATIMEFSRDGQVIQVDLEPRSLVILTGDARYKWTHAIAKRKSDLIHGHRRTRQRRVSMTCRSMS